MLFLCSHEEIARLCRLAPVVSRGTQTSQDHDEYNEECLTSTHSVNASIGKLANSVARPVILSRAKVPAAAARVLPEAHLPLRKAAVFCDQDRFAFRPEPPGRSKRCHMVSQGAEAELRARLLDAGAATVWPLADATHTRGEPLIADWFTVPHSQDADSFILDRRPPNQGEKILGCLRLPLGCTFLANRACWRRVYLWKRVRPQHLFFVNERARFWPLQAGRWEKLRRPRLRSIWWYCRLPLCLGDGLL